MYKKLTIGAVLTAGIIALTAGAASANTATLAANCDTATANLYNFGPKAHDLVFGGYVHKDGHYNQFGGPMSIDADQNGTATKTISLTALTTPGNPVEIDLAAHWYDGHNQYHAQAAQVTVDCGDPISTTTQPPEPTTTTTVATLVTTTPPPSSIPKPKPVEKQTPPPQDGGIGTPMVAAEPATTPPGRLPFTGSSMWLGGLGVALIGIGAGATIGYRRKEV